MATRTVGWCGVLFTGHKTHQSLEIRIDDEGHVEAAAERARGAAAAMVAACGDMSFAEVLTTMLLERADATSLDDRLDLAGILWALSEAVGSTWMLARANECRGGGLAVSVEVLDSLRPKSRLQFRVRPKSRHLRGLLPVAA